MPDPKPSRRTRILVIDDDPRLLHRIDLALQHEHDVATTASWGTAPTLAEQFRPDLIVLDVALGEDDAAGFELLDSLKRQLPDADIILMTGYKTLGLRLMQALHASAFYYLQKPFEDAELAAIVARCILQRWLLNEYRISQKYRREVEDARALQAGLVPATFPHVNRLAIDCRYVPRFRLGGDFVDFALIDESRVALVLADIAGHGLAPAMLTAVVKSAFQSCHQVQFDPGVVVERVSESLAQCTDTHFVTLIALHIDPDNERLEYVNAGHPSCLKWGLEWPPLALPQTGPMISPLDKLRALPHEKKEVSFAGSERLLLMSDGILDMRGEDGFFGEVGILDQIGKAPMGGPILLDGIIEAANSLAEGVGQEDDITLVSVCFL